MLAAALLLVSLLAPEAGEQFDPDLVKSIRGIVRDQEGAPVPGARVFIYDPGNSQTRTLRTDDEGQYEIHGLPGNSDYEVRVALGAVEAGPRTVTSLLSRSDNILNFTLDLRVGGDGGGEGRVFETFDGLRIYGEHRLPEGIQAPIPIALLLHGFGEDRDVWDPLAGELLAAGWAVLALDLRGHGESAGRAATPAFPDEAWRGAPRQFPLDLEPALDWLQTQPRLATDRIVVIGSDVGASLALIAAGRYSNVATAVAIDPHLDEALSMAGTAQEFRPRSALLVTRDQATADAVRRYVTGPAAVLEVEPGGEGTSSWLGAENTREEILRWVIDVFY